MNKALKFLPILAIFFSHLLSEDISTEQIRFNPETGEIIKDEDNDKNEQNNIAEKISPYDYLEKLAELTYTNGQRSFKTSVYLLYGLAIISPSGILLNDVVSKDQRVQVGIGFGVLSYLTARLLNNMSKTYISPSMAALNSLKDLYDKEKDERALEALVNLTLEESSINNKLMRSLFYRNGQKPIQYTAAYALNGYYKQAPIDEHYSSKNIFFRSVLGTY